MGIRIVKTLYIDVFIKWYLLCAPNFMLCAKAKIFSRLYFSFGFICFSFAFFYIGFCLNYDIASMPIWDGLGFLFEPNKDESVCCLFIELRLFLV